MIYTHAAAFLIGAAVAGTGAWRVQSWRHDSAELARQELIESDARLQRMASDKAAGKHAAQLAALNDQLGDAREKIASLPGRECLSDGAVGMLNATGNVAVPAPASEPASAPAAASSGSGIRFATDRDIAGYIALCRTRYAEVSEQLNKILDIEDALNPQ